MTEEAAMTGEITVFDAATGQSLYVTSGVQHPLLLMPGQTWREGAWPGDEWRLDTETGDPAPLLVFAPIVTLNTLANLPPGTRATFEGKKYTVDDGVLELAPELGLPELVHVILTKPGYATWRENVSCG